MLKELLVKNSENKIISVCLGLLFVSLILFIVYLTGLDKIINIIILDDYFFGVKTELFYIFYLIDIGILLAIVHFLKTRITFGVWLGIFWSIFNFFENIFDIPIFISDPHMTFEELVFIFLYAYLTLLFVVNYYVQKHSTNTHS